MTLGLEGALVNCRVLEAQAEDCCRGLLRVENALDMALEFEKVVLAQENFLKLNLDCLLNALRQVENHLLASLLFDVLVDVAVQAVGLQLHIFVASVLSHNT